MIYLLFMYFSGVVVIYFTIDRARRYRDGLSGGKRASYDMAFWEDEGGAWLASIFWPMFVLTLPFFALARVSRWANQNALKKGLAARQARIELEDAQWRREREVERAERELQKELERAE